MLTASILRIYVICEGTNVKLPDDYIEMSKHVAVYTGLFISPSGTSELDCATTKTDTVERSISIDRESLKVFFLY